MSALSEEEARTKWCPESRVAMIQGMAANWSGNMQPVGGGYGNIHEDTRCKASECMMWRWHDPGFAGGPFGYCGKAGKP